MAPTPIDPHPVPDWYKDAIIYELHVKAFFDSDGDGVGDFRGLVEKLDYLQDLGVTAVWLLPFYPSPLRDDGYDIADFKSVNPTYGRMRDFRLFVKEAHRRGLRVITELVINHTSDQHPWFQRARHAKRGSKARDFYVWSDDDKKWPETRIIFSDTEISNWTWDPVAQQYYWHRFFSHQPDLNFDNPQVVKAVIEVMRYWLDMGVDGLRLDAIPYLVERDGTNNENLPETHQILKRLRAAMDESHPHAFFLAEANQWPEDTLPYFGDGDECQMSFHFPLMPRMYMAMAQEDRHPVTDIMRQTPDIPANCQWGIFLRNHDELTLEMVTDRERDYLWNFYAAEKRARINFGIRRRLAPLMENDRRKIELLNSLLFSMPGTPILYYGDEIGMGDNFFLGDRDGVRTPMQWSPDRNGGFSKADPARLYLPPVMDPIYGFDAVNVEAQQRASSSLLNWMRRIMEVRKVHPAFGRGALRFLYPGNRKILAYLREHTGDDGRSETILCVANLSRQAQAVELDLHEMRERVPVEMIGRSTFPPIGDLPYLLTLPAYGFYWFLLTEEAESPAWHEPMPEPLPDFYTLVLREGWKALARGDAAKALTRDVLPPYVTNQRWFAAKGRRIASVRLADLADVPSGEVSSDVVAPIVEVEVEEDGGTSVQRYFLPVALVWNEEMVAPGAPLLPFTMAKVRRGARLGAMVDAGVIEDGARAMIACMLAGREVPSLEGGSLVFRPAAGLPELDIGREDEVRRMGVEQSNTSVLVGDKAVLKLYRKLAPGVHPELEIGRFLTDVAGYPHVPPLLGTLEHVEADGTPTALAVLQGFVRNQGDGWSFTRDYLARELDELRLGIGETEMAPEDRYATYLQRAATLGTRIAELHRALAIETGDPAFDPEPMDRGYLQDLTGQIVDQTATAFAALRQAEASVPEHQRAEVRALIDRRDEVEALIQDLASTGIDAAKTRHHGDLHLGQVLVTQADFTIVDFEGEPQRSLEERRAKKTPLRDVAGMLRSFDYAAWAVVMHLAEDHPDWFKPMLDNALLWRDMAGTTFMAAYAEAAEGCPSWPADWHAADRLIDLLQLEKALYEIGYEAANRPAWLIIPVRGVARILDAHAANEETADGE